MVPHKLSNTHSRLRASEDPPEQEAKAAVIPIITARIQSMTKLIFSVCLSTEEEEAWSGAKSEGPELGVPGPVGGRGRGQAVP